MKVAMEKFDRGDLIRLINRKAVDEIVDIDANNPPAEVGSFTGAVSTSACLSKLFKAFKIGLYTEVDDNKPEVVTFTLRQDGTASGLVWFRWKVQFR